MADGTNITIAPVQFEDCTEPTLAQLIETSKHASAAFHAVVTKLDFPDFREQTEAENAEYEATNAADEAALAAVTEYEPTDWREYAVKAEFLQAAIDRHDTPATRAALDALAADAERLIRPEFVSNGPLQALIEAAIVAYREHYHPRGGELDDVDEAGPTREAWDRAHAAVWAYPVATLGDIAAKLAYAQSDGLGDADFAGNSHFEQIVQDVHRLLGATPDTAAWEAALAARNATDKAQDEAHEACCAAMEACEDPPAPDHIFIHRNGKRDTLLRPEDWGPEGKYATHFAFMPPARAAEIKRDVEAHWAAIHAERAAKGVPALEAAEEAADEACSAAVRALTLTRVPTVAALKQKFEALCWMLPINVNDADSIRQTLTYDHYDLNHGRRGEAYEIETLELYRDVCALAGQACPTGDVTFWDAEAWIADFMKVPGHLLGGSGCAFQEPLDQAEEARSRWGALEYWQKDVVKKLMKRREDAAREAAKQPISAEDLMAELRAQGRA